MVSQLGNQGCRLVVHGVILKPAAATENFYVEMQICRELIINTDLEAPAQTCGRVGMGVQNRNLCFFKTGFSV